MSAVERAAHVAQLEQHLEDGQNWDRLLLRCVNEECDPALRIALLTDPELYAELEQLVFESLAEELDPV